MKKVCIVIFILLLILVSVLVFGEWSGATGEHSYEDTECSIFVKTPKSWKCKNVEPYEGDENTEGSPDAGLEIYIGDSETSDIYIFRQVGKIAVPMEDVTSSSVFTNTNGLRGTRYKLKDDERVSELIVFDNEFYGVSITMEQGVYDQNKTQIEQMLESIVIKEKSAQ